jgi:hypothetical protein
VIHLEKDIQALDRFDRPQDPMNLTDKVLSQLTFIKGNDLAKS